MNSIFHDLIPKHMEIFQDDCLLKTKSFPEMFDLMVRVFKQFREAKLKLNLDKCSFMMDVVPFLSMTIFIHGITPQAPKLEEISKLGPPTNIKAMQRFLGMCNVFRAFVPKMAEYSAPLSMLTKKDIEWEWTQKHQDAFDNLKNAPCSEPIYLAHADFNKGFKIHTDASYFAIAGILTQDGRLVACTSKKLKPYQLAYPIREKELLAVVHSLETFRYYIENNPDIVIFTDHQSLLNITTMPQKDRIYRWILTLLEFSFKIEYIEGGKNVIADCMSRLQDELLVFDPALRMNAQINAVVTRSNNNAERNNRHVDPIDIDMDFLSYPITAAITFAKRHVYFN